MSLLIEILPARDTARIDARQYPDIPPDYITGKWSIACALTLHCRPNRTPADWHTIIPGLQRWAERWGRRHGDRPVSSVMVWTSDQLAPGSMFAPDGTTLLVRWKA